MDSSATESALRTGDQVTVAGFPRALGSSYTQIRRGVASIRGRDVILDEPVGDGYSGGPVLRDGNVGALIYAQLGVYSFAIPAVSINTYLSGHGDLWAQTHTGEEQRVSITVVTAKGESGDDTVDTIVVAFSTRSIRNIESPSELKPLQEFAIPGEGNTEPGKDFTMDYTVGNDSIVGACYVQVLNRGNDGWAGEFIEIVVDGNATLPLTPLYPRTRGQRRGGIEKFNERNWGGVKFWEGRLPGCSTTSR